MQSFNRDLGQQLAPFFLRLVFGIIFLTHGISKFATLAKIIMLFASIGIPFPMVAGPAIALLETCGGLILILGLGWVTRLLALLLATSMVVAIVKVTYKTGFIGGYEYELALLAGLIAIALSGPGKFSLLREKNTASNG
jgi:putative oxidoreductase